MMPQRVHANARPNIGTGASSASGRRSALPGDGSSSTTRTATARRYRACCRALWERRGGSGRLLMGSYVTASAARGGSPVVPVSLAAALVPDASVRLARSRRGRKARGI
jgi:hypothetical protein